MISWLPLLPLSSSLVLDHWFTLLFYFHQNLGMNISLYQCDLFSFSRWDILLILGLFLIKDKSFCLRCCFLLAAVLEVSLEQSGTEDLWWPSTQRTERGEAGSKHCEEKPLISRVWWCLIPGFCRYAALIMSLMASDCRYLLDTFLYNPEFYKGLVLQRPTHVCF